MFVFHCIIHAAFLAIVVTPDNTIISGHRRYKAIQSLGWTEVECEVKDIHEDEIDVHIVLYNQSRVKVATEMLRYCVSIGNGKNGPIIWSLY